LLSVGAGAGGVTAGGSCGGGSGVGRSGASSGFETCVDIARPNMERTISSSFVE
jgi:hypothetical protein